MRQAFGWRPSVVEFRVSSDEETIPSARAIYRDVQASLVNKLWIDGESTADKREATGE